MKILVPIAAALLVFAACAPDPIQPTPVDETPVVVVPDTGKHDLKGKWTCYQYTQISGPQEHVISCDWKMRFSDSLLEKDIVGNGNYSFTYKVDYLSKTSINIYNVAGIPTRYSVLELKVGDHYEYIIEGTSTTRDSYRLRK